MTEAPAPQITLKPENTGNPMDETIDFVVRVVGFYSDNRSISVQERELVPGSGVLPRDFPRFTAATTFPYQDDPRRPPKPMRIEVGIQAENVVEVFQKAMPLLVAEMDRRMKKMEDRALVEQIRRGAAEGVQLNLGKGPRGP